MRVIEDIKEIQRISYDMLVAFDAFCKNHDLTYYIAWGTLLGAVRHKGFIPWDDDIDIMIPRIDFNKLAEYGGQEICDGIRLLVTGKSGKYVNANIRLSNTYTCVEFEHLMNPTKQGLWITIFPIDKLPDQSKERKRFLSKIDLLYKVILMYSYKPFKPSSLKGILARILYTILTEKSVKYLYVHYQKLLMSFKNTRTQSVGILSIGTGNTVNFPADCIDNAIMLDFMHGRFPAPTGYDKVLRATYGDYMQLPPLEERKPKHEYTVYAKC